jgi:hypothetical protein
MRIRAALLLVVVACGSDSIAAPDPSAFDIQSNFPAGWILASGLSTLYVSGRDNATVHGGTTAVAIAGIDTSTTSLQAFAQTLRADNYRGKRVRVSAWVRTQNVSGTLAGLWMRVDGQNLILGIDNSANHHEANTTDWHQIQVVLDVPQNAVGFLFGGILAGRGVIVFDDFTLDVVPTSVPTTASVIAFSTSLDAATIYAADPDGPGNLDFESK